MGLAPWVGLVLAMGRLGRVGYGKENLDAILYYKILIEGVFAITKSG